ncbi:MAG: hypothetical protein U0793_16850 [Gemmataceae bacterium]
MTSAEGMLFVSAGAEALAADEYAASVDAAENAYDQAIAAADAERNAAAPGTEAFADAVYYGKLRQHRSCGEHKTQAERSRRFQSRQRRHRSHARPR